MARFSQGFLSALANPQGMQQAFNQLGQSIGQLPAQYRTAQQNAALNQIDTTTPEGQIQLLEAQMQTEKDPNRRAEMGRSIIKIQKQITETSRSKARLEAEAKLADQLEANEDPTTANLLRSGAITAAQGNNALKAINIASKGSEARKGLVKSLGLEDSEMITESSINNLSDAQFSTLIREAGETEERRALAEALRNRDENELADAYEEGFYTQAQIGQMMMQSSDKREKFTGRERKLYDGKIVFTANVTDADGNQFVGWYDYENSKWVKADPAKIEDLPKDQSKSVNDVTSQDMKNAAIYLSQRKDYSELPASLKEQAKLQFALLSQKYMDKGKSAREAFELANSGVKITNDRSWYEFWKEGDSVDSVSTEEPLVYNPETDEFETNADS